MLKKKFLTNYKRCQNCQEIVEGDLTLEIGHRSSKHSKYMLNNSIAINNLFILQKKMNILTFA